MSVFYYQLPTFALILPMRFSTALLAAEKPNLHAVADMFIDESPAFPVMCQGPRQSTRSHKRRHSGKPHVSGWLAMGPARWLPAPS